MGIIDESMGLRGTLKKNSRFTLLVCSHVNAPYPSSATPARANNYGTVRVNVRGILDYVTLDLGQPGKRLSRLPVGLVACAEMIITIVERNLAKNLVTSLI